MLRRALFTLSVGALLLAACGESNDETPDGDGSSAEERGLLVLATRLEPSPARLVVYAADPSSDSFELSPGTYSIEATDGERVATLGEVDVRAGEAVSLPGELDDANSERDTATAEAIGAIAGATLLVDRTRLTALEAASANQTRPLFADGDDDVSATLDELWALYAEAGAVSPTTLDAIEHLRERLAWRPATNEGGPKLVALGPALAPAQEGLKESVEGAWESIKESFESFFGYAGAAGERASGDILIVAEEMTAEELEDAFARVSPALTGGASNFQEMLDRVARGDLDDSAAQIRLQLWADPTFASIAQDQCVCNSPSLSTAHQEGAELVTRGAELQAAIVQTALAAQFPGMTAGFEKSEEWIERADEWRDQGNEWVEYLEEVYADPLGALEDAGRERLEEALADRIGADIALRFPGMDEEVADRLTSALSGAVIERVPELADLVAEDDEPSSDGDAEGDGDGDTEGDGGEGDGEDSGGGTSPWAAPTTGPEPTRGVAEASPPAADAPTATPVATATSTPVPTRTSTTPPSPTASPTSTVTPTATPTATTAPPPPPPPPPTATATTAAPVVSGSVVFIETVSGGSIDAFQTTADLVADFGAGSVSGSLSGGGGGDRSFNCFVEGGPVLDTATVRYSASYSASFGGSLSGEGAFSAGFNASGSISGQLVAPFTHPDCTHLNSEPIPGLGGFSGSGSVSGVVSPAGAISISSSWSVGGASVAGGGSGQGSVN